MKTRYILAKLSPITFNRILRTCRKNGKVKNVIVKVEIILKNFAAKTRTLSAEKSFITKF